MHWWRVRAGWRGRGQLHQDARERGKSASHQSGSRQGRLIDVEAAPGAGGRRRKLRLDVWQAVLSTPDDVFVTGQADWGLLPGGMTEIRLATVPRYRLDAAGLARARLGAGLRRICCPICPIDVVGLSRCGSSLLSGAVLLLLYDLIGSVGGRLLLQRSPECGQAAFDQIQPAGMRH